MTNTKQTIPVRLDVEFSDHDIDIHLFGSGFIMYDWWRGYDATPDGYRMHTRNPDTWGDERSTDVSFDDIRRTMGNMVAEAYRNPHYYSYSRKQIMDGIRTGDWDFDASGADEILQVACFGESLYS